jgi:outer membrane lipoprotein-sorting protein
MRRPVRAGLLGAACLTLVAGCAAKRPSLPTGAGTPYPDFAAAYESAVAGCRTVDSLTATLGLSGRAGSTKLRGRVDAGLAAPGRIRLELFPPLAFGNPAFVLVATGDSATLVLPRENRVLRGEPAERIVEALAGVPLGGEELRRVIAGCGLSTGATVPSNGRSYENGWLAADTGDGSVYLRQSGAAWRVAASSRGSLSVQYSYSDDPAPGPHVVNVRTTGTAAPADISLTLSDVQFNVPLGDDVFEARVPPDAVPMSIGELKRGMGQQ